MSIILDPNGFDSVGDVCHLVHIVVIDVPTMGYNERSEVVGCGRPFVRVDALKRPKMILLRFFPF